MSFPRPASLVDKPYITDQAYHGTSSDAAREIARSGFKIRDTRQTEDRFGPGVYFWENSIEAAIGFAVNVRRFPRDQVVALRARVVCKRLLDLMTSAHFRPYTIVANLIARSRNLQVLDVKPAAVLSVMKTAGWIDGARLMAPHGDNFKRVTRGGELWGPMDVIICVYEPQNIVVLETPVE